MIIGISDSPNTSKMRHVMPGEHMVKILICDDDCDFLKSFGNQVRELLQQRGQQAKIHTFQQADAIPKNKLEECELAFIDIEFAGWKYNGIDIARKLREVQPNAVVIFVTNFPQYAPEGYEVHAFRYLLKGEIKTKLNSYLTLALRQLQTVKQTLHINISGEHINVPLEDILYIESHLHTVVAYVQKKPGKVITYSFYAAIGNLEEQLSQYAFLRIHKSYLVNMKYLQKFQCKEAVLSTGTVLRGSEQNYRKQKKEFLLWKGRQ